MTSQAQARPRSVEKQGVGDPLRLKLREATSMGLQ
jgi:hypothetical protein